MRVHALTMFASWGLLFFAQLLFHVENPNFPMQATLSQLSTGALISVVALFLLYMMSTAVRETRDLHVEENHLHEDGRRMTEEMEEHSLFGWAALSLTGSLTVGAP
jgi:alkylated DNA repair dioxygenase AlkB